MRAAIYARMSTATDWPRPKPARVDEIEVPFRLAA